MAFHRTIVARAGFESELAAHLDGRSTLVGPSGQWLGPVADETEVIEAATEHFETNAPDSVVAPDSVEAWDFTDFTGEILLGWKVHADGWFSEDN